MKFPVSARVDANKSLEREKTVELRDEEVSSVPRLQVHGQPTDLRGGERHSRESSINQSRKRQESGQNIQIKNKRSIANMAEELSAVVCMCGGVRDGNDNNARAGWIVPQEVRLAAVAPPEERQDAAENRHAPG